MRQGPRLHRRAKRPRPDRGSGPSSPCPEALRPVIESDPDPQHAVPAAGVLLISAHGWGELRRAQFDYAARPDDVLVPPGLLKEHDLLTGSFLSGKAAPPRSSSPERRMVLRELNSVDGVDPGAPERKERLPFKALTSINPQARFRLSEK